MRALFLLTLSCLLCRAAFAAEEIPLWPGVAPGSESWSYSEQREALPTAVIVRNVVKPTLTVYRPVKASGTAVIICPGGAFLKLDIGKEGDAVAHRLNSIGITAFVLKYRTAPSATPAEAEYDPEQEEAYVKRVQPIAPLAIADVRQAVRLVRSRATEWGVRADRIGVMGFSAGGFLAIAAAASPETQTRPDFAAPIYGDVPGGLKVPANAPPLFIVMAGDDPFGTPQDSVFPLYKAWTEAHGQAEVHIYPKGGHGFAVGKQGLPVDGWTERFADWLRWLKFLPKK